MRSQSDPLLQASGDEPQRLSYSTHPVSIQAWARCNLKRRIELFFFTMNSQTGQQSLPSPGGRCWQIHIDTFQRATQWQPSGSSSFSFERQQCDCIFICDPVIKKEHPLPWRNGQVERHRVGDREGGRAKSACESPPKEP